MFGIIRFKNHLDSLYLISNIRLLRATSSIKIPKNTPLIRTIDTTYYSL
jgi:hypothetical protein